jgi:hypothetical protein
VVDLGRVDAESAATNSQWVFQTSVDVTLLLLLLSLSKQQRGQTESTSKPSDQSACLIERRLTSSVTSTAKARGIPHPLKKVLLQHNPAATAYCWPFKMFTMHLALFPGLAAVTTIDHQLLCSSNDSNASSGFHFAALNRESLLKVSCLSRSAALLLNQQAQLRSVQDRLAS